ncbi:MAG: hypothetical protein KUG73_07850 [Pseudomonadales bacterium]|nr:hypothetical protein [Pseudomonadales bacterium]
MKHDLTERMKQKILDAGTQDGEPKPLSYPESSFEELNEAGLCKPFSTRIPISTIKALEVLTNATGESRSEVINALAMEALAAITEDESMAKLKEAMTTAANAAIQEELETACRKKPRKRHKRRHSSDEE